MELDTIRELLGSAGIIINGLFSMLFAWLMLKAWWRKDDLRAMIYFLAVWTLLNSTQISLMSKKLGV